MEARPPLISAIFFLLLCLLLPLGDGDQRATTTTDQDDVMIRGVNRKLMTEIDCGGLCSARCIENSRPNLCKRACGTCCLRCKCVPPGTSGNRELCGTCYTDMTTHRNQTKCP